MTGCFGAWWGSRPSLGAKESLHHKPLQQQKEEDEGPQEHTELDSSTSWEAGVPGGSASVSGGHGGSPAVAIGAPASSWLRRMSTQGGLTVPSVSQAALIDRLQRRPERVAVMACVERPAQPADISWCSALHLSCTVASLLNTPLPSDYDQLLKSLIGRSGLELHDALQQCGLKAWQAYLEVGSNSGGRPRQAVQLQTNLVAVTVPTQGLGFDLTVVLTPLLVKVSGGIFQPAVFIEHLVEHHEATLEQQLRYKDMLLSKASAILTICDLQGNVLHQNAASIQYAGNRTPLLVPTSSSSGKPAYNYFQQALQHQPDSLDELLEEIDMGCEWNAACVKVPASLQPSPSAPAKGRSVSSPSIRVLGSPDQDLPGGADASSASTAIRTSTFWDQAATETDAADLPMADPLAVQDAQGAAFRRRAASMDISRPQTSITRRSSFDRRGPGYLDRSSVARASGGATGQAGFKPARSRLNLLMKNISGTYESGKPQPFVNFDAGTKLDGAWSPSLPKPSQAVQWQELQTQDDYWSSVMMEEEPGSEPRLLGNRSKSATVPKHAPGLLHMNSSPVVASTEEGASRELPTSWHEIKAWPTVDPSTGATLVVVSQVDMTERREAEMRMTQVSEACVSLLELMFPRHGFTSMSKEVEPVQVMQFLNSLYSAYDQLVDEFGVYKVETVGDCYVVAGGLMTQDEEGFACVDKEGRNDGTSHALAVYRFAQAVLRVAASTPMPHNGQPVQIRIGLHSGPITSGIIGHRMPKFCLFGDSMNTCSRMETTAPYGSIHLSQATYELLAEQQAAEGLVCTGGVEVKGKGRMVTYVYSPPVEPAGHLPQQMPTTATSKRMAVQQVSQDGKARATPHRNHNTSFQLAFDVHGLAPSDKAAENNIRSASDVSWQPVLNQADALQMWNGVASQALVCAARNSSGGKPVGKMPRRRFSLVILNAEPTETPSARSQQGLLQTHRHSQQHPPQHRHRHSTDAHQSEVSWTTSRGPVSSQQSLAVTTVLSTLEQQGSNQRQPVPWARSWISGVKSPTEPINGSSVLSAALSSFRNVDVS